MINEIKKIVQSDPETKNLKLSDDDILIAYQYILQKENSSVPGYQPKLVTEPYLQIVYEPTKEKLEEELNRHIKKNLEIFESDTYIENANLNDFVVSDQAHVEAFEYVEKILKEPKKYHKGFYLYGPYGTGKSFFLAGLAKKLTKEGLNVLYCFMPDLIRSMKASIGTNDLEKKINHLKRCDVLILDDIGGENMSVWFRDEILLPILHYRMNAKKTVHFSSNSSYVDLAERFKLDKDEDMELSLRIIRRIKELSFAHKFSKRYKID